MAPTEPGAADAGDGVLPDDVTPAFQTALRGEPEVVRAKLTAAYGDLAEDLLRAHGDGARWLDLGCGDGLFMELLRTRGWRVDGIDASPWAIARCAERGLDARLGRLPDALAEPLERPPAVISLIQVIEHLPRDTWLPTLRTVARVLAPGGTLVLETIDPRNPAALQSFFADLTHTWAAHPTTLRVMAELAGFSEVEVRGLNPGTDGRPLDFALIARTP